MKSGVKLSVYIAIDLGTTGCRSILFDASLNEISSSYEEYGLITPKENYVEQNAELWWELTLKTAKNAIEKSCIDIKEIDAISISSQGITIVPIDNNLKPLCNALSWLDMRAEDYTRIIDKDFGGDKMFKLTGKTLSSAYTLPKVLWIKENLPEIYSKAYKLLMPLDYLTAKFTGKFVTDYSMATGTLMYDIKNQCWSELILNKYGISKDILPEVLPAGTAIGEILPDVAKELGLKKECIVALGAQDQKCAAFGVGLKEGTMTISLGTAAAVTKLWNEAKNDVNNGIGWCGYIDKASYVTEGVISTAGTCLRWVRDVLYPNEADSYRTIDREAELALNKNSDKPMFFYPFLTGESSPKYYSEATGNFYGITLSTVRGDFALAVMQGIAYQIRILLEAMDAYGKISTLIIFGGVAKSKLWCQIISDITGLEVFVPSSFEAASAGAARLASLACGNDTGALKCVNSYSPSERKEEYNKFYKKYLSIEEKLWEDE